MRVAAIALSAAFLVVLSPFTAAQNSATAPTGDAEGLVRTKVRGLQSVYAVPDADLSRYRKVMLDPIEVSFSRNWDPQVNRRPMTAEEKQRIRTLCNGKHRKRKLRNASLLMRRSGIE